MMSRELLQKIFNVVKYQYTLFKAILQKHSCSMNISLLSMPMYEYCSDVKRTNLNRRRRSFINTFQLLSSYLGYAINMMQKHKWIYTRLPLFFFLIILFLFFKNNLYSQLRLDNWTTYSSLWDTRSSSIDARNRLWLGTSGGAYSYSLTDGSIREYRNINALHSLDITALECNADYNSIYFGCSNGTIDIFVGDTLWMPILDIKNSVFVNKIIKDFEFFGSKVFIAGGFGLTVFDQIGRVFIEDAFKFGDFQPNTFVNKIAIKGDEIWLATEEGVAKASLGSSLSPKDAWRTFSTINGLPVKAVKDIEAVGDEIFVLCQNKVFKLSDTLFTLAYNGYYIDISSDDSILYLVSDGQIISTSTGIIDVKHEDAITGLNIFRRNNENLLVVYYKEYGFKLISSKDTAFVLPNSPAFNQFKDIDVSSDGDLWACSDGEFGGKGLTTFDGSKWKNILGKNYPTANDWLRNAWTLRCHPDGRVISGCWGPGFLIVEQNDTNYLINVFNKDNAPITSSMGDSGKYIVIGESAIDSEGTIWLVQLSGAVQLLISLDKNGKFTTYNNQTNISNKSYNRLTIDNYGTKWAGSWANPQGIYYLNEKYSPVKFGTLTTSNSGLCNNEQNTLAVDKNNIIWIGTETGLCFLRNPESVFGEGTFFVAELSTFRNVAINDIMVDALNNKWIATNDGVWVLNSDGDIVTKDKKAITSENSPLVSNEVLSLATDPKTGLIYIGTRQGLSVVSSLSIEPLVTFDLECYPQPFKPERDRDLVINGLAADADVRITTSDGRLVKAISGFGKTIFWDGKDNLGNYVSSGIYIINANSLATGSTSIAKIAVIRD